MACNSPFAPIHPRLCGFKRISLNSKETKTCEVTLDPYTDTVINDAGERCKAEHYTLYAGISQPDELSVKLAGVRPVEIKK